MRKKRKSNTIENEEKKKQNKYEREHNLPLTGESRDLIPCYTALTGTSTELQFEIYI